jgi:hypothetical protein
MRPHILIGLAAAATIVCWSGTTLAGDLTNETRPLDAGVSKVYLGGSASLQLRQGPTPSLVAYGDADSLKKLVTTQSGDALHIETHGIFLHAPSLRIEMTLPKLSEFISTGVGASQVSGFGGDSLQLSVTGTGDLNAAVHYQHITARSSGVAGLTLNDADSDSIDIALPGAGHVVLTGKTKNLTIHLNGVGNLDAQNLTADTVTSYLDGVGSVKVTAKESANMYLRGVGAATVYGNPTVRNAVVSGFGKVSWE